MYEITQSLDTFLAGLNSLPELIQENQKLRDENTQLRSQLAQVEFVFEENQQLINETGIAYDREYEQLGVKVIGRNPNQPAVVTINKGALDGLQEGNVAVTEKILLGEVVEVQPTTAKVRLLTNAESQLPVKNSDENIGLLVGVNARELLVTQILQTKEIEIGDLVYSAGIDQRFPPDLFIGEITTIDADERASTKQAQVTSPIDWQRLDRFKILIY
jgi:rod shape-determining protein MreC